MRLPLMISDSGIAQYRLPFRPWLAWSISCLESIISSEFNKRSMEDAHAVNFVRF